MNKIVILLLKAFILLLALIFLFGGGFCAVTTILSFAEGDDAFIYISAFISVVSLTFSAVMFFLFYQVIKPRQQDPGKAISSDNNQNHAGN